MTKLLWPSNKDKSPAGTLELEPTTPAPQDEAIDPDEYILQRWLELADAVLRQRDAQVGNPEDKAKQPQH